MKAILKEDMIVNLLSPDSTVGVEIGNIPKETGIDRLRFDGKVLIDLINVEQFWVRANSASNFELHIIPVTNSSLIKMKYEDRKKLYLDGGVIKVASAQVYDAKCSALTDHITKNKHLKEVALKFLDTLSTPTKIQQYVSTTYTSLSPEEQTSLVDVYKLVYYLLITK